MQAHELLLNRKNEITAEIEKLQNELKGIDRALAAMGETVKVPVARADSHGARHVAETPAAGAAGDRPATKDDAILDAIKAGNETPAKISAYIRERLGVTVNDASTRTRLSRMKAAEKIDHDGFGWRLKK